MPSGMQTDGLGDRPATHAPFGERVKHAADLDRAAALRGRPAERSPATRRGRQRCRPLFRVFRPLLRFCARSEEHTSELQSLMRISYAVFCLKKKNKNKYITHLNIQTTLYT